MSKPIKITIAAHCDKAAREHNEDNCLVCTDVASGVVDHAGDGTYLSPQINLGDKGCLLVVADGMGGMNAGEVASQMAVEAVRNYFSKDKLDEIALEEESQISRFIWDAIVYADACIKSEAMSDSEKSGMGTTIVVLWILGRKAYIGWCGDSRIYRFNKQSKILTQLTKDHSYVQMLVDQHQITEEEAFDHPDSNVLLRSLGDAFEGVTPEMLRPLNLSEDDVFLMCSDGLCGVLRNNEIRSLLTRASVEYPVGKLNGWHELLWEHARKAGWHDNVTTVLCHVGNCQPLEEEVHHQPAPNVEQPKVVQNPPYSQKTPKSFSIIAIGAVVLVAVIIAVIFIFLDKKSKKTEEPAQVQTEQVVDSTENKQPHKSQKLPSASNRVVPEQPEAPKQTEKTKPAAKTSNPTTTSTSQPTKPATNPAATQSKPSTTPAQTAPVEQKTDGTSNDGTVKKKRNKLDE